MAKKSLTELFGANANQTSSTLTITKADFTNESLTASGTNTAESLLMAIILKAKAQLTETNRDNNADQFLAISDGFDSIISRGSNQYIRKQFVINLDVPLPSTLVDPDNF